MSTTTTTIEINKRGRAMRPRSVLLVVLAMCFCAAAQEAPFVVKLTRPLSTAKNHNGDAVAARVVTPEDFKGDTLSGRVTESKSGDDAVLNVAFDTLNHNGTVVPISATVTSLANSRGQQNADDNGHAVRRSNRTGNTNAARQIGSSLGGFLGGRKGAAISTATDVSATLATIQVSGQGPNLSFAAGTEVGLSVTPRGGRGLDSLPPNRPTPAGEAAASPASTAEPTTAQASNESGQTTPSGSGASTTGDSGQPNFQSVKIEFIPGEKTIFYDDFTDMAEDEPPPHWRVRDGKVQLEKSGAIRQMTTVCPSKISMNSSTFDFPKNFTVEIEAAFGNDNNSMDFYAWPKGVDGGQAPLWHFGIEPDNVAFDGPDGDKLGSHSYSPALPKGQPIRIAFWIQEGRARAYVNGERIADVNQVTVPANAKPADHFTVRERCDRPTDGFIALRSVRVAESAPDFSTVLASSGKYVTHGITFDVNSDRLKLESAPVLKMVVRELDKNPNLKLAIGGYTDSTGGAAKNLDLSKRRAQAVRAVLVQQFGVDESRLTADGFGASKPIASNDTADGRAQNRRVEFVKQ